MSHETRVQQRWMEVLWAKESQGCQGCVDWKKLPGAKIGGFRQMVIFLVGGVFGLMILNFLTEIVYPNPGGPSLLCLLASASFILMMGADVIAESIVGQYVYFFQDENGFTHCHAQAPIYHRDENRTIAVMQKAGPHGELSMGVRCVISGSVLRLKVGGLFKKNLIFRNAESSLNWFVKKQRRNKTLDLGHSADGVRPLVDLKPEHALQVINTFNNVDQLFGAAFGYQRVQAERDSMMEAVRKKHEELKELSKRYDVAVDQRDFLAYRMFLLVDHFLTQKKQKPRASADAKHSREFLEKTMQMLHSVLWHYVLFESPTALGRGVSMERFSKKDWESTASELKKMAKTFAMANVLSGSESAGDSA